MNKWIPWKDRNDTSEWYLFYEWWDDGVCSDFYPLGIIPDDRIDKCVELVKKHVVSGTNAYYPPKEAAWNNGELFNFFPIKKSDLTLEQRLQVRNYDRDKYFPDNFIDDNIKKTLRDYEAICMEDFINEISSEDAFSSFSSGEHNNQYPADIYYLDFTIVNRSDYHKSGRLLIGELSGWYDENPVYAAHGNVELFLEALSLDMQLGYDIRQLLLGNPNTTFTKLELRKLKSLPFAERANMIKSSQLLQKRIETLRQSVQHSTASITPTEVFVTVPEAVEAVKPVLAKVSKDSTQEKMLEQLKIIAENTGKTAESVEKIDASATRNADYVESVIAKLDENTAEIRITRIEFQEMDKRRQRELFEQVENLMGIEYRRWLMSELGMSNGAIWFWENPDYDYTYFNSLLPDEKKAELNPIYKSISSGKKKFSKQQSKKK